MMTGFVDSRGDGRAPSSHVREAKAFTDGLVQLVTKGTASPDSRREPAVSRFLENMSVHPWAREIPEPKGGVAAEEGFKVWIQVEEPKT